MTVSENDPVIVGATLAVALVGPGRCFIVDSSLRLP